MNTTQPTPSPEEAAKQLLENSFHTQQLVEITSTLKSFNLFTPEVIAAFTVPRERDRGQGSGLIIVPTDDQIKSMATFCAILPDLQKNGLLDNPQVVPTALAIARHDGAEAAASLVAYRDDLLKLQKEGFLDIPEVIPALGRTEHVNYVFVNGHYTTRGATIYNGLSRLKESGLLSSELTGKALGFDEFDFEALAGAFANLQKDGLAESSAEKLFKLAPRWGFSEIPYYLKQLQKYGLRDQESVNGLLDLYFNQNKHGWAGDVNLRAIENVFSRLADHQLLNKETFKGILGTVARNPESGAGSLSEVFMCLDTKNLLTPKTVDALFAMEARTASSYRNEVYSFDMVSAALPALQKEEALNETTVLDFMKRVPAQQPGYGNSAEAAQNIVRAMTYVPLGQVLREAFHLHKKSPASVEQETANVQAR